MQRRDKRGRYAKRGFSTIALLGGIAFIVLVALAIKNAGTISYQSETATTTIQTVEVQPEWAQDEDAVKAAQAVIRKKELQSQEADLIARREAILAEYEAADAELKAELTVVQKEIGTY